MSKYGHRPLHWFEAIVNKLGGEERAEAFLRGDLVLKPADRFHLIWKTIKLGTGPKTGAEFIKAIHDARCVLGDWACAMMRDDAFTASGVENELDLIIVSNHMLGFKKATILSETFARAKEYGLPFCPAEAGPQLRIQYLDQPLRENLIVAMEPIPALSGTPNVFEVRTNHDGMRVLVGTAAMPDALYSLDALFVFGVPRKE